LSTIVDCKELLAKAVDVVVNCHQKPTTTTSPATTSHVTSLFAKLIPKPPPPRVAAPTPPAATHLNAYSDPDEAYLVDRIQSLRQNSDEIRTPVEFEQIAGMDEVKRKMRIASFYALHFVRAGPKPTPAATLLYGPPGTGKTLIVGSFAKSRSLPLFSVTAADIKGRYNGESEK
jgi:ATPase family associated with various cellular activities (AAA)